MKIKSIFYLLIFTLLFAGNSYLAEQNIVFNSVTNKKNFGIKLLFMNSRISTGKNNAMIEVYDMNKNPVSLAKIDILLWMGEHGHYSSATPVVKEIKPGIYEVSRLDFEMKGRWEIIINVKKDKTKDRVSFVVDVE